MLPLLAPVFLLYNALVILVGVNMTTNVFRSTFLSVSVMTSDVIIVLGLIALCTDLLRSANTKRKTILHPQVSPHFQARPKVSENAAFWRRSSWYRSIRGRSLASGMLGMRS